MFTFRYTKYIYNIDKILFVNFGIYLLRLTHLILTYVLRNGLDDEGISIT